MNPTVSVILPVYNGEKYVAEAIESILNQDYDSLEVIVVDDGSTDGTGEVLQRFVGRIRILQQKNRGLGASRNAAIRISQGDYFAFLDHDDFWMKNKIRRQMEILLAQKEIDPLLFTHVKQFLCPTLSPEEKNKIWIDETEQPGYFAGTLLISRKRFEEIGYFLEEKVLGEFVDWYLRATEKKIPMQVLSETMLYRRVHQQNMGRQKEQYNRRDYLKIIKASLARRRQEVER